MEYTLTVNAERSVIRESLKGVIWTIFFNRLFGPVTPTTGEFLSITYPMATNLPELDSTIDEKIDQLLRQLDKDNVQSSQINISFYEKSKKKSGWFGKEDERHWEYWKIKVNCFPSNPSTNLIPYEQNFEENMLKILQIVDNHKQHIPAITSLESSPFPYSIDIGKTAERSNDEESWGDYIKKIL